jgi:hypothetical protein
MGATIAWGIHYGDTCNGGLKPSIYGGNCTVFVSYKPGDIKLEFLHQKLYGARVMNRLNK